MKKTWSIKKKKSFSDKFSINRSLFIKNWVIPKKLNCFWTLYRAWFHLFEGASIGLNYWVWDCPNDHVSFKPAWTCIKSSAAKPQVGQDLIDVAEITEPSKPIVQKVLVSVYYEALCPDSRSFVIKQLVPTFQRIMDNVLIELIPYGKATVRRSYFLVILLQKKFKWRKLILLFRNLINFFIFLFTDLWNAYWVRIYVSAWPHRMWS